jgi:hypothetical protein
MTLQEARRAALLAHPGWPSTDIENAAKSMLAAEGVLDAKDKLADAAEEMQTEADARRAALFDEWQWRYERQVERSATMRDREIERLVADLSRR